MGKLDDLDVTFLKDPDHATLKDTPLAFLATLNKPTVIDITGTDTSRTRVISTLIHGNEPSGLIAAHRFLLSGITPTTNMRFIISSVIAAKMQPVFSNRFLPDENDLNRCFGSDDTGPEFDRARTIEALIMAADPECVVDLHNTSGSGPAFAVTTDNNTDLRALASLFCHRMIMTGLRLGSLMELDTGCPTLTIECGGADDDEAHDVAFDGIMEIATVNQWQDGHHHRLVDVLTHPMRVELAEDMPIDYCENMVPTEGISMRADIEHCNTGITPKDTLLGWAAPAMSMPLCVKDEQGEDVTFSILSAEDGKIKTAQDLRIFMATSRPDIAISDCLFYVVPTE